MSTKGRKKTPTAIKSLRGTNRKDRTNPNEPNPGQADLSCPDRLFGYAEKCWNRLAPELDAMGVLTSSDIEILIITCQQYQIYQAAFDKLFSENVIEGGLDFDPFYEVTSAEGHDYLKEKPLQRIMERAWDRYKAGLIELGMTPAARSKVSVVPRKDKPNKFKAL